MVSSIMIGSLKRQRPATNPWLLILCTALVPLLLLLFIFFRWYQDRNDFGRVKSQFLQRQNTVMAYNAMEISTGFGDLLEKAGRDVQILELFSPDEEHYRKFYLAQMGDFTRYDQDENVTQAPLPFYNRISYLDENGQLLFEFSNGKGSHPNRPLNQCLTRHLCDEPLITAATKLPVGEVFYGSVLRYYSSEGTPEDFSEAGLSVAYRGKHAIYLLTIDYRHLQDHLTSPAFPYDPKRNLLDAYQKGNYLYIVDRNLNIISHPHYWKAAGIDKKSGRWVSPMIEDSDSGQHPINIGAYQRGVLKDYFDRLLKVSFVNKGVDIFKAPNLAGTSRVLSVAPIFVSKGQYKNNEVFGHVVIGCNVDYFEEPKTMIVPYY